MDHKAIGCLNKSTSPSVRNQAHGARTITSALTAAPPITAPERDAGVSYDGGADCFVKQFVNTGATHHVTYDSTGMYNCRAAPPGTHVMIADDGKLPVEMYGDLDLILRHPDGGKIITLTNVKYLREMKYELISIIQLITEAELPVTCVRLVAIFGLFGDDAGKIRLAVVHPMRGLRSLV